MEKGIKNADVVTHKLGRALTRVINQRLEIAREERQKRKEMVERQKTEAMAVKRRRARRRIISSRKEEEIYESDIGDETDLD